MKIEHSPLLNDFLTFWFETRVDDIQRYETMLDFMRHQWYTTKRPDHDIVLSGELSSEVSEDQMIEEIKPILESAIRDGSI